MLTRITLSNQGNSTIITPFNEVNDAVQKVVGWLNDIGIDVTRTRIGKYRKDITLLIKLLKEDNRDELNRRYPTMANSLYEANELISIYRGLKKIKSENLVAKLKDLLKGPEWFVDENTSSSSNRSRNTAFELVIASKIAAGGIQPDFATLSDIAFSLNAKKLLVECKRPQSASAVEKKIKEASKQLKRRIRTSTKQNLRGIVAIDLSKVNNPSFDMLEVENAESLKLYLTQSITMFIKSFDYLRNKKHKNIIGMLVRFTGMALLKDMNMLTYFQQWGLEVLPKAGSTDYDTAIEVEKMFR